uniref:Peptidase A1 domain-containing protein n=1 Tax=Vannella robusta TaxID=1487602 RepID=A0A7S4MNC0_9EUKA|mmetsp:Transcript_4617/g.5668  ORF Transcript_4617/g.5668 Transcript_4617/m.5668 type:complete len:352 (+) Transcript_4617:2-1057(+)
MNFTTPYLPVYQSNITLGSPAQSFEMILDTGSNFITVPSIACKQGQSCEYQKQYNHTESSTYCANGTEFSLSYGGGDVNGFLSGDQVTFSGITVPGCQQQFLEVETEASSLMEETFWQGTLGLAFQNLYPNAPVPLVRTMNDLGLLPEPQFSLYFDNPAKPPEDPSVSGQLRLGWDDGDEWTDVSVVPLVYPGFLNPTFGLWAFELDDILVDGTSLGLCEKNYCWAYVDSGGPLVNLPYRVALAALRVGGPIRIDPACENLNDNPSITFVISGVEFTFEGEDYSYRVPIPAGAASQFETDEFCELAIGTLPSTAGELGVQFGDPFLLKFASKFVFGDTPTISFRPNPLYSS